MENYNLSEKLRFMEGLLNCSRQGSYNESEMCMGMDTDGVEDNHDDADGDMKDDLEMIQLYEDADEADDEDDDDDESHDDNNNIEKGEEPLGCIVTPDNLAHQFSLTSIGERFVWVVSAPDEAEETIE